MRLWSGCDGSVPLWISPHSSLCEARPRLFSFLYQRQTTIRNEPWHSGRILQLVEQATDNLPEAFRLVFVTRVIEGMSVEETSELLGIKPETVKTRLHRARQLVRDQLDKQIGPVLMEAFPFAGQRCERMIEVVMRRLGFAE